MSHFTGRQNLAAEAAHAATKAHRDGHGPDYTRDCLTDCICGRSFDSRRGMSRHVMRHWRKADAEYRAAYHAELDRLRRA